MPPSVVSPEKRSERSFAFVFVCDAGPLEPMACLVAASLRRNTPAGSELVAAIPQADGNKQLSPSTQAALDQLGVRRMPVSNPVGPGRPHANKIACLTIDTAADRLVFVDTDVLCLREFTDDPLFDAPFCAKPADLQTWTTDEQVWRRTYAAAGAELPSARLLSTVSRETIPPYFNSGVLVIAPEISLASEWSRCARILDATQDLPTPEPWSDQPSLAVALALLRVPYGCLDETYNYPAHLKALPAGELPILCHYHVPTVVHTESALRKAVSSLRAEYRVLDAVLDAHPGWSAAPRCSQTVRTAGRRPSGADVLVSGIPHSGAHHLARLLSTCEQLSLSSGPDDTGWPFSSRTPWDLRWVVRQLRFQLADSSRGLAILTAPELLCGLDWVRDQLPDVRVVICVRDPFETIALWKRADAESRLDSLLADAAFAMTGAEPAERRARQWAWLAERVLADPATVVIDHHELVARPSAALRPVLRVCGVRAQPQRLAAMAKPERTGAVLDGVDHAAIAEFCLPLARELGLSVPRAVLSGGGRRAQPRGPLSLPSPQGSAPTPV